MNGPKYGVFSPYIDEPFPDSVSSNERVAHARLTRIKQRIAHDYAGEIRRKPHLQRILIDCLEVREVTA